MNRPLVTGFMLLASAIVSLTYGPAASAAASAPASVASSKATVRHWIGTWRGKVSQHPPAPPGDPRNPYKIVVTIRSVSKHTIGTIRYPAWKCSYTLVKTSVTAGKLRFVEKVVHPGPFGCVNRESVVMKPKAKGASFRGTADGATETGSVSKSS
jgi:hypothetical protein